MSLLDSLTVARASKWNVIMIDQKWLKNQTAIVIIQCATLALFRSTKKPLNIASRCSAVSYALAELYLLLFSETVIKKVSTDALYSSSYVPMRLTAGNTPDVTAHPATVGSTVPRGFLASFGEWRCLDVAPVINCLLVSLSVRRCVNWLSSSSTSDNSQRLPAPRSISKWSNTLCISFLISSADH